MPDSIRKKSISALVRRLRSVILPRDTDFTLWLLSWVKTDFLNFFRKILWAAWTGPFSGVTGIIHWSATRFRSTFRQGFSSGFSFLRIIQSKFLFEYFAISVEFFDSLLYIYYCWVCRRVFIWVLFSTNKTYMISVFSTAKYGRIEATDSEVRWNAK